MKRTRLATLVLGPALLLAALLAPGTAAAAGPISSTACAPVGPGITCNLWAKSTTLTLPGGPVTIWGYSDTAGGTPTLPANTSRITRSRSTASIRFPRSFCNPFLPRPIRVIFCDSARLQT